MRSLVWFACAAAFAAFFGVEKSHPASLDPVGEKTGLVTLYARDPLAATFGFSDARYGHIFQDHMVKNRGSDIAFTTLQSRELWVGIEGGRKGSILDLGTADSLQKRYGYTETNNGGQGYASIRREGGRFVILKDYEKQTTQSLTEAEDLGKSGDRAGIAEDHVYLVRITDGDGASSELVVKILVVAYDPGRAATIRWSIID
jgi:hypothetical protein